MLLTWAVTAPSLAWRARPVLGYQCIVGKSPEGSRQLDGETRTPRRRLPNLRPGGWRVRALRFLQTFGDRSCPSGAGARRTQRGPRAPVPRSRTPPALRSSASSDRIGRPGTARPIIASGSDFLLGRPGKMFLHFLDQATIQGIDEVELIMTNVHILLPRIPKCASRWQRRCRSSRSQAWHVMGCYGAYCHAPQLLRARQALLTSAQ
jgi:hypothetical protein